jgi:flagellar protein FliT
MTPAPRQAAGGGGGGEGLLAHYQAIEQASADMLQAARCGDWALFDCLERTCGALITQLNQAARVQALEPELRKARLRILQRILVNDAQIRYLADPAAARVAALLTGRAPTVH